MFRCRDCKKPAYLIRNVCAICDPDLHNNRCLWQGYISKVEELFKRDTGKQALEDWCAFEIYLARHSEMAPPKLDRARV